MDYEAIAVAVANELEARGITAAGGLLVDVQLARDGLDNATRTLRRVEAAIVAAYGQTERGGDV